MEGGHGPENARGAETCASKVTGGEGSGGWEDGALASPCLTTHDQLCTKARSVPQGKVIRAGFA